MTNKEKVDTVVTDDVKAGLEAEELRLQELMDEKKRLREEMEMMLNEEKEALKDFKLDLILKKEQDKLREEGKLIKMKRFIFHYQEQAGGTIQFTKQGVRFELKDGDEYCYRSEIADHINSLSYLDRALTREAGEVQATLKVVGRIPRCSATVLETFEKEFDIKTDIPDQKKWRAKAAQVI